MEQVDLVMTHERAMAVIETFCKNRARGVPEAHMLLMTAIGIAMRLSRNNEIDRRKVQRLP